MAIVNKPTDYFNTVLYSGDNASDRAITGVGFQPDFVWIKNRNNTNNHLLQDSVRGLNLLVSNSTVAEQDVSSAFKSFDSDGFTITEEASWEYNNSGKTYASWNWKANGAGVSNTAGTITSTVSANTTSGFSIVSWTADGGNATTVGHGLGSTPKIVIYKDRGGGTWYVLYTFVDGSQDYLVLNGTNASAGLDSATYGTATSTTISNIGFTNGNNMIAYCFAEVKGFSKFGSYTGNGSADGTFVYTGFKPAFVLMKGTNVNGWLIIDNKRTAYNSDSKFLYPQASDAEDALSGRFDFTSNGFKLRNTWTAFNSSGQTYIYMAFAEQPFVTSTDNGSIPATAR
jgi:hypothetical protein